MVRKKLSLANRRESIAATQADSAPVRRLHLEELEARLVLSGSSLSTYSEVSSQWFGRADDAEFAALNDAGEASQESSASDRWIVRLTPEAVAQMNSIEDAMANFADVGAPIVAARGLGLPGQLLVETPADQQSDAVNWLASSNLLEYYERDATIQTQAVPNDAEYGLDKLAGLNNTGLEGGIPGADIDAELAWDINTGSRNVVAAVIDTGVDLNHEDLTNNIWINPGELPAGLQDADGDSIITFADLQLGGANSGLVVDSNSDSVINATDLLVDPNWADGVDDDGNGFVDDLFGWDFRNDDNSPMDDHGHGTHVAGTMGAEGDNATDVTGVAWQTSIMALKFLGNQNVGFTSDAIEAINYATMMRTRTVDPVNLRVLNNSWGSNTFNFGLQQAIAASDAADMLFVAAAGNGNIFGGVDNDNLPFYPASYGFDSIVSVAASDRIDGIARFSNFGETTVDLAAPGVGILSTERSDAVGVRSGTSMAAPHVSGVAMLLFSRIEQATAAEVKAALMAGVETSGVFQDRVVSDGRLNAFGALQADTFSPKPTLDSAPDITLMGASPQTIAVQFEDTTAVDVATLDDFDVVVRRLDGSGVTFSTSFASVDVATNGPLRVAQYEMQPPGGTWDTLDNGDYEISVVAGQVGDPTGNVSSGTVLGTFSVALSNPGEFFVSTLSDSVDANPGDGNAADAGGNTTLRAAIQEANAQVGNNTIFLAAGTFSLGLGGAGEDSAATGDLDITDTSGTLTIVGSGANRTFIDAAGLDRVFDLRPGVTVVMSGVSISGGNVVGDGGAVLVDGATLTLADSAIVDNQASGAGGGISIAVGSAVDIARSTLSGNQAGTDGGAIASTATLGLTNVTISTNTATGDGGGLHVSAGTSTVENSTLTLNDAQSGGGIDHAGGVASLHNTLVAANTAASNTDVAGSFTSLNNNLIGDVGSVTDFGAGTGDLVGSFGAEIDPLLSPLQLNTGTTRTHVPLPGSPAIDAGDDVGAPVTDQRLVPRPQDGNDDAATQVDIGAVERFYGTISGVHFHDLDGNSVQDAGEPLLEGWTIYVDANDNEQLDPGEPFAVTASDGTYTIGGVTPGATYNVRLVLQPGWEQTAPTGSETGIVVTSILDGADVNVGDGTNLDAQGNRTLRAAIQEANVTPAADVITLPAGTFDLTLAGTSEDGALTGDLDITSEITIVGAGQGVTTIDANAIDRLFDVHAGGVLTLQNLTLTGGSGAEGGAIRVGNGLSLTLNNVEVVGNAANSGPGGAISGFRSTLDITNSAFTNNTSDQAGGAISLNGGVLNISGSTFTANQAPYAAALDIDDSISPVVTITSSVFDGNINADASRRVINVFNASGAVQLIDSEIINSTGGGISTSGISGSLQITRSNISGNLGGGGIEANRPTTVIDSTISGNTGGFGGGIRSQSTLTISGSTISGNTGTTYGGGIMVGGTLNVTNSTFSGNHSNGPGGAIKVNSETVTLTNVTITDNTATAGGGVSNGSGAFTLTNTIIAGNTASSSDDDVTGPLTSGGSNLIGDIGSATGLIDGVSGDIVGDSAGSGVVDALLGPLASNGGLTATHLLLTGSPAIDAGTSSGAPSTDQRGTIRPLDGDNNGVAQIDIGAVEVFDGFIVNTTDDTVDVNPGDGIAADGNGSTSLRAAVMEANTLGGAHQVILPSGVFTLSLVGAGEDMAATGDLDVTANITLVGNGADVTTIDAAGLDRVFDVQPGGSLTLSDATVTGGDALNEAGGGIRNAGTLDVGVSAISGNTALTGGGIANFGTLTVDRSTISGNSADQGGGIYNDGAVSVNSSTLSGNTAEVQGGGIHNAEGGILSLTSSTVAENAIVGQTSGIHFTSDEFLVNTNSLAHVREPSIAMAPDGFTVVAWDGPRQGNDIDVFAQVYEADGTPNGTPYQVNADSPWMRFTASVSIAEGESYAIVYSADEVFGSGYEVSGWFWDGVSESGTHVSNLNVSTAGNQYYPQIEYGGGRYVAVWHDPASGIRARAFDVSGSPLSGEIAVSSLATPGKNPQLSLSAWDDGDFVVAWDEFSTGRTYFDVFSSTLTSLTGNIALGQLGLTTARPEVVTTSTGFAAVWMDDSGGVYARLFDRLGNPTTAIQTVAAPYGGDTYNTSIVDSPDGYVVMYHRVASAEDNRDVFAQRFDGLLRPVGDPIHLSQTIADDQLGPEAAISDSGEIFAIWEQFGLSEVYSILGRRLRADSLAGGVYNTSGGIVELGNTIIAGNSLGVGKVDAYGEFSSTGGNLIGEVDEATGFDASSDLVGDLLSPIAPLLGPLVDNGGTTLTHLPLPGSPVIDAASNSTNSVDQRGVPRIVDGDGDLTAIGDIGAVEVFNGFLVNTTADTVDANPGDGVALDADGNTSLRSAVMEANTLGGAQTIALPPGSYRLTITGTDEDLAATGDLDITANVTLVGAGPATTTIDAGGIDRVLDVQAGGSLRVSRLTVTGGDSNGQDGGGIRSVGDLLVDTSVVSDNTSASGGGIANFGTLMVDRSTLSGNSADSNGGGVYNNGVASVTNSTLSGNSAVGLAGGIYNAAGGTASVAHSTIVENTAEQGTQNQLDLDFGFNGGPGGGTTIAGLGTFTELHDMVVNADGTVALVGFQFNATTDFAVARLLESGEVDSTFNEFEFGTLQIDFGHADQAYAGALQSSGKLVVAGSSFGPGSDDGIAVARVNTDGTLDETFGTLGKTRTTTANAMTGVAMAVQDDDKIVVAGRIGDVGSRDFVVVRYTADGVLDPSFNGGAPLSIDFGSGSESAVGVEVLADGKILVGGTSDNDIAFARIEANGNSLDSTFGTNGKAVTSIAGATSSLREFVVGADGKVIAAAEPGTGMTFFRFNSDGSLDTSFGVGGYTTVDLGTSGQFVGGLAPTDDSGVIVGAAIPVDEFDMDIDPVAFHIRADGTLDASFGGTVNGVPGILLWDVSPEMDMVGAVALRPDGTILVGGRDGIADADFVSQIKAPVAEGVGIFNAGSAISVQSTIVASNTATIASSDVAGAFDSAGGNLIGDAGNASGLSNTINGDQVGNAASPMDPLLGPLADNGGPTPTHLPLPGSPAIDAGNNDGAPATDQRGVTRILDGEPDGVVTTDVGAVEVDLRGTTFVVNTTSDSVDANPGDGIAQDAGGNTSLRAAIQEANASAGFDTIALGPGTYTLTLSGTNENAAAAGDLDISDHLNIVGAGADVTIIDASALGDRVFEVLASQFAGFTGVTITGGTGAGFGSNADGGAILNRGSVRVEASAVDSNTSAFEGGGLRNLADGVVAIVDSTISNNTARVGGGLHSEGQVTVVGSTFSGNATTTGASRQGGAIFIETGSLVMDFSTITQNTADDEGGGIYSVFGAAAVVKRSIIAQNTSTTTLADDLDGIFISTGSTLVGDRGPNATITFGPSDLIGDSAGSGVIDPLLGPLQDNGGSTLTHSPLAGSPAIDAGNNLFARPFDQRGVPRILDGDEDLIEVADIGSVEFFDGFIVNTTADTVDVNPGDGVAEDAQGNTSLRAAVMEANALAGNQSVLLSAATYAFTLSGAEAISAAVGDLDIDQVGSRVTIIGAGVGETIIDAQGIDRVFEVTTGSRLTLQDLTITGGDASSSGVDGGGIYNNQGLLTIRRAAIVGNIADGAGGGIFTYNSSMSVFDSTIASNTANSTATGGGGIFADGAAGFVGVVRSTISGNSALNGGGVFGYSGEVGFTNSTISGNTATSLGGGLASIAVTSVGYSTITANHSGGTGGGISNFGSPIDSYHSIIAANTAVGGDPDVEGDFGSFGYNLIGVDDSAQFTETGDQRGTTATPLDPMLGALADNGGPTLTHALLAGSPAIDGGDAAISGQPATDQRGENRIENSIIDIGAYEASATGAVAALGGGQGGIAASSTGDDGLIAASQASAFGIPGVDVWTVTVRTGDAFSSIDFGARALPGEIRGQKFHDLNGDGNKDPFEPGLAGWEIYLDENNNQQHDSGEPLVVTGANGTYAFVDLASEQTYVVAEVAQLGWVQTFPAGNASHPIFLNAGESRTGVDFGNVEEGTGGSGIGDLAGQIFNDINADGDQDSGELGISGVTVYLDFNDNGQLDGVEPTDVTDAAGNYEFQNVVAGEYTVRVVVPAGGTQTSPSGVDNRPVTSNLQTQTQPNSLASGDFDRDGNQDLAVVNAGQTSLSIFFGDGLGGFQAPSIIEVGAAPISIQAVQFDDDNSDLQIDDGDYVDLIVGYAATNFVSVLFNDQVGGFIRSDAIAPYAPWFAAPGDFDQDGDIDVVTVHVNQSIVSLLERIPAGFISPAPTIASGQDPASLITVQLNDDNSDLVVDDADRLDLAWVDIFPGANTVSALINDGGMSFTRTTKNVGGRPFAVVAGDFNGDGFQDLAATVPETNQVALLINNQSGDFALPTFTPAGLGPTALTAEDLDGDGDVDLAVTNASDEGFTLLRNDGSGSFTAEVTGSAAVPNPLAVSIVAAQLDDDPILDLAIANGLGSESVLFLANRVIDRAQRETILNGSTTTGVNFGIQLALTSVDADFDGDGDVDGADFLAWQVGFGIQSPNAAKSDGDADNDGDVDAADLSEWQTQYGTSGALQAVATDAGPAAIVEDIAAASAVRSTSAVELTAIDAAVLQALDEVVTSSMVDESPLVRRTQPEQIGDRIWRADYRPAPSAAVDYPIESSPEILADGDEWELVDSLFDESESDSILFR